MFDTVRKHNKVMQILLFLLIMPSFVLFGLDGYSRFNEKGQSAASVAGEPITQTAWDQAHRQEAERLRASLGGADPRLLDSPAAKYATLERLVRDRLLIAASVRANLSVSNQRVAAELQQDEFIRTLKNPDGRLDIERYRQVLAQQGKTPEAFENQIRNELASRQVLSGLVVSGLSTPAVADAALNAYFQRRVIQLARFDAAQMASKLGVTDAEIEQYYKDNLKDFQVPEQANVEYMVLDMETVKKTIVVSDADLKSYYEQNAARLSGQEERRASHILINAPQGGSVADKQKAKDKSLSLLASVRQAPQTFAEMAKKESQDTGSAPQGGDLNYFSRGAMTKAFEEAVFSMKKGDISDVVETEFGFHIIKLTDIKAPKQRSFAEMRGEIEADVKKQQAQKKYAEYAEAFSNGVYEQSDSLKHVADRLKLEIKTAENIGRKPAEGVRGVLAHPKFLSSLFSADTLNAKRNTEAVEVAANTLVSGRVTRYTPARSLELTEVKDRVKSAALLAKGAQAARAEGMQKLQTIKTDSAAVVFSETTTISRLEKKGVPGEIVLGAMRAETAGLPSYVGVDMGNRGYAIVKVTQVLGAEDTGLSSSRQAREQYNQWWATAEGLAYYNALKERFKVSIKVVKPSSDTPESSELASSTR